MSQNRETVRVYAVVAPTAAAALAQAKELSADGMDVELVGSLARNIVRRLALKPGEVRLV